MQLPGVDDASTSKETAAGHATGLERGSVEVEDSNPNLPEPSHPHFFGALPLQRGVGYIDYLQYIHVIIGY